MIHWFTVVAQAINFLILVWLLRRFLYRPILQAIDARERDIAAQLSAAEAKKAEAQKECDDFQHKNQAFEQERVSLLEKARAEATAAGQQMLEQVAKQADLLRGKRQEALRIEQRNLGQTISRWAQKEVFAITRATLMDLASTGLEERMAEVFVRHLGAMTGQARQQLSAALKTSPQPARIRSAFDLPMAQRSVILKAVMQMSGAETQVQFETASELVSGIELSSNGQKVAWSIADHLNGLQKSAEALLNEEPKPACKPTAKVIVPILPEPINANKPGPLASEANH